MAPATLAGATARTSSVRPAWDRDTVISAIQEWVATYGEPPRAADWNPSSAKWSGQLWRVARYRAGRADGSPWPALNSAKRPFGGSLNAAVRAAGFEPAKPGPKRRRDVDPEQAGRADMSPEGRAMVAAALARAREAERRVAGLERRLAVASTKTNTTIVRERVADPRASAKAAALAAGLIEARTAAKRLAARLERSEATVSSLRDERRELKAARDRAADRVVALERLRADAPAPPAPVMAPVPKPEVIVERVEIHEPSPDAPVLREALAEARNSRRVAEAAELRAARAERELRETAAVVCGEPRRLKPAELAALRSGGPSGPAVMAAALKALATARAEHDTTALRAALHEVARAAITWLQRA